MGSNPFWLVVFTVLVLCKGHNLGPNGEISEVKDSGKTLGQPWPMPQSYKPSGSLVIVDEADFYFHSTGAQCELLTAAYKRYAEIIFGPPALRVRTEHFKTRSASMLNTLEVNSKSCPERPTLDSDESYNLSVTSDKAVLTANEVWGALRGLETFSQIIYQIGTGEFIMNMTEIQDFPRFRHRGVLLDTARHFLKKEYILKNLDAMAMNKFNVFHWHIVDDQSFPYYSKAFPAMSEKGAYDSRTHVYLPQDVSEIIEYARQRGIRVVVEFDSPGHTLSWGKGIPDILTECYSGGKFNGDYGPMNPALNSTMYFLMAFFKEVAQVFPDHYIFLGGDEVSFSCWASNPGVNEFMKEMGFGEDYKKLENYYVQMLSDIITNLNKTYLVWQEVVDNGVKIADGAIVNVWKGGELWLVEMAEVTKNGHTAVLSSCWYLNYINYGSDWPKYYKCDPQGFEGTDEQKKLVIGGETTMWAEYVDDTNLISRLWPRAAAVGERLWSAASVNDSKAAELRIAEHRCRMVRRGFSAEELIGPGYCGVEY